MANRKLNVAQFARMLSQLGDRANGAMRRGLESGAKRAIQLMQRRTEEAGIYDQGGYRRGWKSRLLSNGVEIYNDASYADVIEKGRRPGRAMPPLAVIRRWAQRRLGLSEKEAKQAAFPIAAAIQERGLEGKHVLQQANPEIKRIIEAEVLRELKAELKR